MMLDVFTMLYNLEFIENGPTERKLENSMSREDQKFMKILQEGTKLRNEMVPLKGNWKILCLEKIKSS